MTKGMEHFRNYPLEFLLADIDHTFDVSRHPSVYWYATFYDETGEFKRFKGGPYLRAFFTVLDFIHFLRLVAASTMESCSWSTKAIQRIYTSCLRSSTPMSSSTQKTCGFSYWAMGFYPDSCVRPTLSRLGDFFGPRLKLLTGGTATTRLRWTVDINHNKV